jgi:ribosomal protein S18 acetylase RimI-like enzyme
VSGRDSRREIRPYTESDLTDAAGVWYRSGRQEYTYLPDFQALDAEKAREIFAEVIVSPNALWVGTCADEIVAFLAMNGSFIDRLYVDPAEQQKGWGTRFISLAKERSPAGLELFTHQQNHGARALYEKLGFHAVRFGVSPPPENVPDVEYHWRPE